MQAKLFSTGFGGLLLVAGIMAHALMLVLAKGQTETTSTAAHLFVKRDKAEKLEPSAISVSRVMLTANQTSARYGIMDEIFNPGMKTLSHKHANHSETFIVLTGKMRWTVAGETDEIGPGDLVYIPPGHLTPGRSGW
ncbi:MAG: cupin domain-containing protein [Chloroflexota bacterium]|nr:cupin domain-containing protein [Chloroflexota bacterium]